MSRTASVIAAMLSAVLVTTSISTTRADDGELTVVLKNGASYRGVLVERVPGDHITIKLATGTIKTFAWNEIDSDDGAKPTTAPPTETTAPPPAPAPEPKPKATPKPKAAPPSDDAPLDEGHPTEPSGPQVFIRSEDSGVVLERRVGADQLTGSKRKPSRDFEPICSAPCNITVASGAGYRLWAPGRRATPTFSLVGEGTRSIDVKLSRTGPAIGGGILLGLGIAGGIAGATLLMVAEKDASIEAAGLVTLIVSGGVLLLGAGLLSTAGGSLTIDGRQVASKNKFVAPGTIVF